MSKTKLQKKTDRWLSFKVDGFHLITFRKDKSFDGPHTKESRVALIIKHPFNEKHFDAYVYLKFIGQYSSLENAKTACDYVLRRDGWELDTPEVSHK